MSLSKQFLIYIHKNIIFQYCEIELKNNIRRNLFHIIRFDNTNKDKKKMIIIIKIIKIFIHTSINITISFYIHNILTIYINEIITLYILLQTNKNINF